MSFEHIDSFTVRAMVRINGVALFLMLQIQYVKILNSIVIWHATSLVMCICRMDQGMCYLKTNFTLSPQSLR